jgi:type I restriction enzyme S subunit
MKKDWEYKPFSDVIECLRTGLNPRVHFKLNTEDAQGYYITVRELKGFTFEVDSKTDRINETAIKRINERSNLKIGDVLFSGTGTIGRTAIVEEEPTWWNIKEGVYAITPRKDKLNSKYLIYLFKSNNILKSIYSKASGATIRSIPMKELNKIIIPIPPLSEQKEIVEYLDSSFAKIDKLKENAAKNLEEAKALFQSALKDALEPKEGWEMKTLKEIGITQTGTTPSKSDSANYGNYMEFIRPSEIDFNGMGGINYNCELKLSEQGASNGRVFEEKSILMVCIGATIGKVGFSNKKISCNQQINVLTPSSEYDYKFVYYSMKSPRFQKMVIKEGTSSQATLPIINKGKWEKLTVQVPSLQEQQSIVSFLDSLSEKVNTLQQNCSRICNECDALKQAILRQVFE